MRMTSEKRRHTLKNMRVREERDMGRHLAKRDSKHQEIHKAKLWAWMFGCNIYDLQYTYPSMEQRTKKEKLMAHMLRQKAWVLFVVEDWLQSWPELVGEQQVTRDIFGKSFGSNSTTSTYHARVIDFIF